MLGRILAAKITHLENTWQFSSELISIFCLILGFCFFIIAPKSLNFCPKKESFIALIKPNIKLIYNKNLLPYYITGFLLLGIFVSMYNFMSFFLTKPPFNISKQWLPYLYMLYISGVLGSMNISFWEKKLHGAENTLKGMSVLGMVGISFYFFENIYFVILGLAIFTYAFFGAHAVCSKSVGNFLPEKKTGTIAFYLLFYYLGASTLGSFSGIVLQKFNWSVFLLFLIFIFGLIFSIFYFTKSKN